MTPFRARLVSEALTLLSAGRDIVLIAFPADEAARLRAAIVTEAGWHGLRLWNNTDGEDEPPIVRYRPFGCVAVEIDRCLPLEMQPVVLYDLSVSFERGSVREMAVRSVVTT